MCIQENNKRRSACKSIFFIKKHSYNMHKKRLIYGKNL